MTYFIYFLGYLQPNLTNSKSAKSINKNTCIKITSIKNLCIRDTYIKNTNIEDTYIIDTYIKCIFVKSIYIKFASTKNIYIKNTYIETLIKDKNLIS